MAAFNLQKDYYAILELDPDDNPSQEDIKAARARLLRQYHPDTYTNSEAQAQAQAQARFQSVGEAYGVLSNPLTRSEYDRARQTNQGLPEGPTEESQDLIQARQAYQDAAKQALRALNLIPEDNPNLYDDVIFIHFQQNLIGYANPYRDDEDEFGEPAKAYGKRKRERVEREIDFFSSFVNQQSQQQWGTWFQKKNTAIPNEAGPNNSLVWPIFRLILSYKNSVYDQSMPNSAPPTTAGSDENTQEVNASGQRLLNPAQMDPQFLYSLLNLKDRLNEPVLTNTFAAAAVSEEEAAPAPAPAQQDALSPSQTFYDAVYPLLEEAYTITEQFGFRHQNDTDLKNLVKKLYIDGGEPQSNPELGSLINFYRNFLDIQRQKRDILLEIGSKNLKPLDGDFVLNDNRLYSSLLPLFTNEIDVEKLTNIKEALNALDSQQLKGFMTRYDEALRDIAKDSEASNSGSYNSTWVVHFKNLTTSLAQYESGDIMPRLTAVLDRAREEHRKLGLSAGYFINVADFERQYPEKYPQIFEAITAQNTSSENSPPVDQIELWLQGWENSDNPEEKIRLYLEALNKPDKEKTSVAEGDTPLPAAPTDETPSEGVSVPAAGSKAPTPAPAPAALSRSPSRRHEVLQRIIGGLGVVGGGLRKRPVLGALTVAVVGTAAAAGIALVANPFRGNGGNGPTTPPTLEAARAAEIEKLNGAIAARIKPDNFGAVPVTDDPVPLNDLLRFQGQGGLSSKVGDISGGTREELMKLAEAAGIADPEKQNAMIAAYTDAYDKAYISAYDLKPNTVSFGDDVTGSVHANAMTESLKAVRDYIKDEHARAASPVGWIQANFEHARDTVVAAVTNTAEKVVGSIPINASVAAEGAPVMVPSAPSPIQSFLSHTRETMSAAMQHAGEAAQHAAHAVGQVVKSEPVQAALHHSATYTAVSLAVTATSVRFQAVREARQAEAKDGPKLNFVANARGLARDFLTRDVGGPAAYQAQLNKAPTKLALARAALIPFCPPVAIAATAMGVTALGASVVHHVTKDKKNLAGVAEASQYLAEMKYVNQATDGMARGFTAAKTFATQAASSPLVTQAMEVTQTTMQTASNAFESAKKRTETMFASLFNRQAAATL
jgi:curved DNA-binding protein CbpA